MRSIFYFLIFPGVLFTAVVGLLLTWVDRKITARLQWRVGPPWYQPFVDFFKLLGKELIIPKESSKWLFLLAPLLGFAAVTIVSIILWASMLNPSGAVYGDLIVVLYISVIPALSVIIGGFASKNPMASLGASREVKLLLAYELPFIISVFVPVILSGGIINLGGLLDFQGRNSGFLHHPSAILAFITAIICVQAKLTLIPFDSPEAEAEITSGAYIEYSGPGLAFYKLTRAMNFFVMPLFLSILFLDGIRFDSVLSFVAGSLKVIAIIVVLILIKNTNPRVRIDQAVKFFWGPMAAIAVVAAILAFMGF